MLVVVRIPTLSAILSDHNGETTTDVLIPPDCPDDCDESLVDVDSLLCRRLDTLGIESLCEVSSLCLSATTHMKVMRTNHEAGPVAHTPNRTCWQPRQQGRNPCPSPKRSVPGH